VLINITAVEFGIRFTNLCVVFVLLINDRVLCLTLLMLWQVLMSHEPWSLPPKDGLYDPVNERDSCGVGFIVAIDGRRSHKVMNACCLLVTWLHS